MESVSMRNYDFLIVGSGLYGATFARLATDSGKRCLVIDKRPHLGGNVYCERVEGINVHRYGPHIFHTSNKRVWEFVNRFADFSRHRCLYLTQRVEPLDHRIQHCQQMGVAIEALYILLTAVFTAHFDYFSRSSDFIS